MVKNGFRDIDNEEKPIDYLKTVHKMKVGIPNLGSKIIIGYNSKSNSEKAMLNILFASISMPNKIGIKSVPKKTITWKEERQQSSRNDIPPHLMNVYKTQDPRKEKQTKISVATMRNKLQPRDPKAQMNHKKLECKDTSIFLQHW